MICCELDEVAELGAFPELRRQALTLEVDRVIDGLRELPEYGEALVAKRELLVEELAIIKREMVLRQAGSRGNMHEQMELNTDAQEGPVLEGKVAE